MNLTLSIIALCTFIAYIVYIISRFGLLYSISDSYYALEHKEANTGLYFTVWCGLITLFTLSPSLHVSGVLWQSILAILMCVGLLFVGASPAFRNKEHRPYHVVGAVVAALCSLALVAALGYWVMAVGVVLLCVVVQFLTDVKDVTLWIEVGCFMAYFVGLILAQI